MLGMFAYEKGPPGSLGTMEGELSRGVGASFSWLSVPNIICLINSTLGYTESPYLRQSSFLSLIQKKTRT